MSSPAIPSVRNWQPSPWRSWWTPARNAPGFPADVLKGTGITPRRKRIFAREPPVPAVDLRSVVSTRQEDTPLRKISPKTNQSAEAPLRSGRFALPKNEFAAFRLRVNCQFDWKRRIISFPALLPSRGIGLHRSVRIPFCP